MDKYTGKVKYLNKEHGFGYISLCEDPGREHGDINFSTRQLVQLFHDTAFSHCDQIPQTNVWIVDLIDVQQIQLGVRVEQQHQRLFLCISRF